ncbi:Protein ANTI-SILENCING 1 [Vigna angularis]|uniref:Protein ANTI-SILENCING 1 n=1 Tax=Phaseolus angularis TaxID=3914 RepID=A0A8T0JFR4_PHAAN|nr:Protein ANTI-SILENCING 1 [Vigna angularis]
MSRPLSSSANVGEVIDFKWGKKRGVGVKNKDTHYYESFVYEGVEYFLYDCVYLFSTDHVETSIGKLIKIYERPTREKMIKVVWFFRPMEIRNFLGNYQPCWNELFLASGEDKGLSDVNYLESIIGKCNVVCTSKDKRNPKPSETELNKADYFFSCTFDVGRRVIIDKFTNEIDGVKVEQFFNKRRIDQTSNHLHFGTDIRPKIVTKTCPISHCQVNDKAERRTSENNSLKQLSDSFPYKKRKITEEKPNIGQSSKTFKEEKIDEKKVEIKQDEKLNADKRVIDVIERPDADKRKWFKKMPWDERLRRAQELDTLVLLNNLDPTYTSYEVEIFYRIIAAMKGILREPDKKKKFPGHLVIDRPALQRQNQEMRNAVSTSHCSQPNTIEYPMSIEWLLHYAKFNACWNALYQRQMKEIQEVKSKLKMDRNFSD